MGSHLPSLLIFISHRELLMDILRYFLDFTIHNHFRSFQAIENHAHSLKYPQIPIKKIAVQYKRLLLMPSTYESKH